MLYKKTLIGVVASIAFALSAHAAERPLITVSEAMIVKASPEKVWSYIKSFDGLPKWVPGVATTKLTEGKNGQVGAIRQIELKNGMKVDEELSAYSDDRMSYSYKLFDGAFPVSNYNATLSVRPNASGKESIIIWTSHFSRKNPAATPPEGEDDDSVRKEIINLYTSSMDGVKKAVEAD